MNQSKTEVHVGDRIRIVRMADTMAPNAAFPDGIDHQARELVGRTGEVTFIDGLGQLWGTWGGLAVNPEADSFVIIHN